MTIDAKNLSNDIGRFDVLSWCVDRCLELSDGVKFSLSGRPYLVGLVGCDKREVSIKKGSQVTITTGKFLEAVHSCFYRIYDKNILYMLPTVRQAELLSKVSFDPIFNYNKWLKGAVDVNNATLKTINGRSIVFAGAQSEQVGGAKDSINLRSIPCDAVYRDEVDLMDEAMVELSKQRLNASRFRIECNFGSPTTPEFGIDYLYSVGDCRRWQIKCSHCGSYTNLVDGFPNTIIEVGGKWIRACLKCHKEIYVKDGSWVADYPERRSASFWVDGLMSPMADLEGYMYRYYHIEGSKMAEFERSILGNAVTEATCQLAIQTVLDRCRNDGCIEFSENDSAIGVDVGETMHWVVGRRTGNNEYRILNMGRSMSMEDLYNICQRYNVKIGVIDKGPDIFGVKNFQDTCGFPMYRCLYSDFMNAAPDFDGRTGIVKCNRNEICDRTHSYFTEGNINIPRECSLVKEYAEHMTKMEKQTINHPDTGIPKTRWVKRGNKEDHWYHATNYFILAASQTSPVRSTGQQRRLVLRNNFCLSS